MEDKFQQIRNELDSLGYTQPLLPECLPLVEKLLLDLNRTTTSLQKYLRISQYALEERDLLESGVEPYKCDNAKLIRECNDLHQAFIHFKEQHEKIQKDLRHQILAQQHQLDTCYTEKKKLMNRIQELEREKVRKGSKFEQFKDKPALGKSNNGVKLKEDNSQLNYKVKDLESKHSKLAEDNVYLKNQIKNRDEQIERLQSLVEGGRSYEAVNKDCCYKNIDAQMSLLQDEITRLKSENNHLQLQLKEAVAKQHEAMRRALHLVERNRQLEKELKDVDEIALAVETECNNTVRGNSEKVTRLQDRINESLILIQKLERENSALEKAKVELTADLDSLKLERNILKRQFEKEQESNKKLTDRINSLTLIENDLNLEIDRLTQLSAEQKRRIAELEFNQCGGEIGDHNIAYTTKPTGNKTEHDMPQKSRTTTGSLSTKSKTGHKKTCKKSTASKSSPSKSPTATSNTITEVVKKCCCESGNCIKNLRDLLDKEVELRQVNAKQSLEDLRNEKEYYMKEYHRVLEQLRNVPNRETSDNAVVQLTQLIKERDNQIKKLEDDIRRLQNGNLLLDEPSGSDGNKRPCQSSNCRNRDRELQIKSQELSHLEVENSTLKAKLQAVTESTTFNEERIKKAFKDMEEHIRKLEDERRDLVKAEVTQRSNISHLEDDYRNVKDQLKQTQSELNNLRANYNQLKLLHEQTDRALSEAQSKVIHSETELADYKSKVKDTSRSNGMQDKEIAKLNSDIQIMKNQLTKIDKEKDELLNNLDDKTERIAALEEEISQKNKLVGRLEDELKELNRKLSKYSTETSTQDKQLRSKHQEYILLEQEYEKEKRLKEAALIENKRLQNDLSSVTCDCREARNELEISKRQVEDLKRQLQHYVAEVKRFEDLMSQKELERSELLDQFKSLSQEAGILESNNHTLETEANHSKIQLHVALDHTTELEQQIQHQEAVIKSYEKQITELSENVARLEMKLREHTIEKDQCKCEIKQMRDLCMKLDKEKESLKSELKNRDERKTQVQDICQKLSSEKDILERQVEREKTCLEAVEKLLSDARTDLTEQRLLNQDLQREVGSLKQKISELEERLASTTEQLDIYQGKALEYSQQNKQLRRDIANERFSRRQVEQTSNIPPTRGASILSTKTLTIPGSTQLNVIGEVLHEDGRGFPKRSIQNDNITEEGLIGSNRALSQPTQKLQRFSEKEEDVIIDLNKLNQNNIDCFEQCNRVKCPLHKKLFSVANSKECEHCAGLLQKLQSDTRTQDRRQSDIQDAERRKFLSVEGGFKVVDFALGGVNVYPNYSTNKYEKNESNEQKRSVRSHDLPNRSVESTRTLNLIEADEVRKRTKGTINLHKDGEFEIHDEHEARNQAPKSFSNIEDMTENESVISTKSLNVAETKDLRRRTMGSVNIHRDICNAEQFPKRSQTGTELALQSSLSQIADVSNKPDLTFKAPTNVLCQGVQDINNPGYRNTKNWCFTQECSQPFVNKTQPSESFLYSENRHSGQVNNSQCLIKTSTNDVSSNITNGNIDATKVRSKVGSFMSASEPNGLSAEKPVNIMDSKFLKANGDQNESRFQAGSSNAKDFNKFKQHGSNLRSGIEFTKHNETCVKFDQNSDSSAIFRKVFSVDGVGLECHCSISSFKCSTDNK